MPSSGRSSVATLVFAWCGAAAFALSLLYFVYCYFVRFGVVVAEGNAARAALTDVALFSVFALHHSLFARLVVKDRLRAFVSEALERSAYTLTASVLFIAVCAVWKFVPGELYRVTGYGAWIGYGVQAAGVLVTLRSSARLGVLNLVGIGAVVSQQQAAHPDHVPVETGGLYGFVRHPVYLGWVLIVFGTPHMTMTRFVFAAISTFYVVVAIPIEERSLMRTSNGEYRAYKERVRWRLVPGVY